MYKFIYYVILSKLSLSLSLYLSHQNIKLYFFYHILLHFYPLIVPSRLLNFIPSVLALFAFWLRNWIELLLHMKKIGNREWKVNAVVCIAYILKNPGNLRVVGIICYQIMTATLLRRRNRGRWGLRLSWFWECFFFLVKMF